MGKFVVKGYGMEPSEIKQKLHQYIDQVEEKKLRAIYTILENEIEGSTVYSVEDLEAIYERRQNHLNGTSQSYSVEEAHQSIRRKKQ